jgi:hypothetical protein
MVSGAAVPPPPHCVRHLPRYFKVVRCHCLSFAGEES